MEYSINGISLKQQFGIYVKSSKGLLDYPKAKDVPSRKWDYLHGEHIYTDKITLDSHELEFECFIIGDNQADFISKIHDFSSYIFNHKSSMLIARSDIPLGFQVLFQDSIEIDKEWQEDHSDRMIGEFKLKMLEPEPAKIVVQPLLTDVGFGLTVRDSSARFTVFWGDGSFTENVALGANKNYGVATDVSNLLVVITGSVQHISGFFGGLSLEYLYGL